MSLADATLLLGTAVEKSRHLAGIMGRVDSEIDRSLDNLERLRASFLERETSATGDVAQAATALAAAGDGFAAGLGDAAAAARALAATGNGIARVTGFAQDITRAAGLIASANKLPAFAEVGQAITGAATAIQQTAAAVGQLFAANPAAPPSVRLPPVIESTAANPDSLAQGFSASLPGAGGANAHLLILTATSGGSFYFNLSTAGYDQLKRQTSYHIATQERLTRRPALQAVSKGCERLSLAGAIFTRQSGAGQLERLRDIGFRMEPLVLTTGYGESFGYWYLTQIDEDQAYLFADGMPRKQTFSLEFERYGEDYSYI